MAIKILCFNIHGGYDVKGKRDLRRVHDLMEEHDIDIGVFQEMETRTSRGGTLADIEKLAGPTRPHNLPGLAMKEGEGWYGNLIVSRFPILRGLVHNLEMKHSYEPRNAVDALINSPLGKIRIIGTHLSLTPWERWTEVRNLVPLINAVEETEKNPLLFMGDINEWRPRSRLLNHLNDIMTPIPTSASFPSYLPFAKLDRVWADKCPFTINAKVLVSDKSVRYLSDHLPIIMTLGT